jgi:hypothetical protein
MLLDRNEIERQMTGRWYSFFRQYAQPLADIMDKMPNQQPCPFTGGKTVMRSYKRDGHTTGGFYHNKDGPMANGITAYAWYLDNGGDTHSLSRTSVGQAMRDISEWLTGGTNIVRKDLPKPVATTTKKKSDWEVKNNKEYLQKIWKEATHIKNEDSLAMKYLRKRGIKIPLELMPKDSIKFHPNLEYREGSLVLGSHPAILILVSDAVNGNNLTIHAHYLDNEGNKLTSIRTPKKTLPFPSETINGGAAWIYSSAFAQSIGWDTIGLAEGFETSLAALEMAEMPVIPTINKTLLGKISLPTWVKNLAIFADHDSEYLVTCDENQKPIRFKFHRAGEIAAFALKDRLEKERSDIKVYVFASPKEGEDFLDLKLRLEKEGVKFNLWDYLLTSSPQEDIEKTRMLKREHNIID